MQEEKVFETLYSKDQRGNVQTWDIKVINFDDLDYSEIITVYGRTNKIEKSIRVNNGKNIGKSNATTHFTQACADAASKYQKKKDQGYYLNVVESVITEQKEINIEKNPLPMLAQDFKKQKNKVIYPCMVQSKLDGMRMIYNTTTGQISTRTGKEYSIVKESGELFKELQKIPKGLILDGELYTNKVNFETLGVLRKTNALTKDELANLQKIEYHIYDIIDTKLTFGQRNKKIQELNLSSSFEKLIYVPTYQINNEEEIKNYHTKFLEEGYEGTMVRNKNSLYKTKQRSSDLLKYKDFQDAEFEIIDFTFEKDTTGKDENLIVWIVKVPIKIVLDGHHVDPNLEIDNNKILCKVRPQGSTEERKELYKKCVENFKQFEGRKLWTKYFEKTADGNLRFPTTKTNSYESYIRDEIL